MILFSAIIPSESFVLSETNSYALPSAGFTTSTLKLIEPVPSPTVSVASSVPFALTPQVKPVMYFESRLMQAVEAKVGNVESCAHFKWRISPVTTGRV
jgi:hypothetical protein